MVNYIMVVVKKIQKLVKIRVRKSDRDRTIVIPIQ